MSRATVTADRLVGGGRSLAHHEGSTWMVAGALPGEVVVVEELHRRAGIVEAVAVEVLDGVHPARSRCPCPHADTCGGCDWPHVDAAAGADLKRAVASGAARGFPDLAERLAQAPITASPAAYRLRARLHWDPASSRLGFYGRQSWRVSEIARCTIISATLRRALEPLAGALGRSCPERVDLEWIEDTAGGQATLALRPGRGGPGDIAEAWIPPPAALQPWVTGARMLSRSGVVGHGWGATGVTMDLPTPLRVPIGGFFQVNRHLVGWLFERVGELTAPAAPTWDLHAGVGFLAAAARPGASAGSHPMVLVEPFRPSARAAAVNLPDAKVVIGRQAETYLERCGRLRRDALVLTDPPRAGMSPVLRQRLAGWRPHRILMLSCDPATWARDTHDLLGRGYRLRHLELVDLFPFTHHVEILALLDVE